MGLYMKIENEYKNNKTYYYAEYLTTIFNEDKEEHCYFTNEKNGITYVPVFLGEFKPFGDEEQYLQEYLSILEKESKKTSTDNSFLKKEKCFELCFDSDYKIEDCRFVLVFEGCDDGSSAFIFKTKEESMIFLENSLKQKTVKEILFPEDNLYSKNVFRICLN